MNWNGPYGEQGRKARTVLDPSRPNRPIQSELRVKVKGSKGVMRAIKAEKRAEADKRNAAYQSKGRYYEKDFPK